jgi:hypothetical protein
MPWTVPLSVLRLAIGWLCPMTGATDSRLKYRYLIQGSEISTASVSTMGPIQGLLRWLWIQLCP